MTLVFHQAALGDFALVLPLLRALPGPVTLVAPWSRGRLAAALIPDLRTSDIDQFEFTRMHAAGGPSRLSPAVAELFEDATLIVDFVGSGDDAWSANLQRLAPDAPYRPLPTGRRRMPHFHWASSTASSWPRAGSPWLRWWCPNARPHPQEGA